MDEDMPVAEVLVGGELSPFEHEALYLGLDCIPSGF